MALCPVSAPPLPSTPTTDLRIGDPVVSSAPGSVPGLRAELGQISRRPVCTENPSLLCGWREAPYPEANPCRGSTSCSHGVRNLRMKVHQADRERGKRVLGRGNSVYQDLDVGKAWYKERRGKSQVHLSSLPKEDHGLHLLYLTPLPLSGRSLVDLHSRSRGRLLPGLFIPTSSLLSLCLPLPPHCPFSA